MEKESRVGSQRCRRSVVNSGENKKNNNEQIARALSYAGFVLVGFELVKGTIVEPIKLFYRYMTFGPGFPFKSYEHDVLSRHKNEFEACLLYLKDFMEVIDANDIATIHALRKHRNELASARTLSASECNQNQRSLAAI